VPGCRICGQLVLRDLQPGTDDAVSPAIAEVSGQPIGRAPESQVTLEDWLDRPGDDVFGVERIRAQEGRLRAEVMLALLAVMHTHDKGATIRGWDVLRICFCRIRMLGPSAPRPVVGLTRRKARRLRALALDACVIGRS
jgi:hypothetical protein